MTYLLDTNTCIYYLNGRSEQIRQRLELVRPEDVTLRTVVLAELLYGAYKSQIPARTLEKVRTFTSRFEILPFDPASADEYGSIKAHLSKSGTLIGPNDLMIAAIARAHGQTLVTHNTSEFSRVPELEIEDWTA